MKVQAQKQAETIPTSDTQFNMFLEAINGAKRKPVTLKVIPQDLVPALSLPHQ